MAIHLDTSTIATDALYFSLVFIFTNIIRIFVRPLALEARLIAQFMAKLVIGLLEMMKKWTGKEHHQHIDLIKAEFATLRNRMKPSKIKIG